MPRYLWMSLFFFIFLPVFMAIASTADNTNTNSDFGIVRSVPLGLPPIPSSTHDTAALFDYGQFLFHSPLLSGDGKTSCGSCHSISEALSGATNAPIVGEKQAENRHAPPVFNLRYAHQLMWDGRASSLKDQIHIPIESKSEMNIDWDNALSKLALETETKAYLKKTNTQKLSRQTVLSVLAAHVRSLVSGDSPFDQYFYEGKTDAISQDAKEGLKIFMRKGQCSTCHLLTGQSALLTDNGFHSIGIGFDGHTYKDTGRSKITGKDSDLGSFKTPTLRNVAQRKFFMHDGSMTSLREVIDYYNRGGNKNAPNLDTRMRPLYLTDKEIKQLIAFLDTLDSPIESYQEH